MQTLCLHVRQCSLRRAVSFGKPLLQLPSRGLRQGVRPAPASRPNAGKNTITPKPQPAPVSEPPSKTKPMPPSKTKPVPPGSKTKPVPPGSKTNQRKDAGSSPGKVASNVPKKIVPSAPRVPVKIACNSPDPSQAFIRRPVDIPAAKQAKELFNEMGINDFSVNIGPLAGWRTVSKLAVRSAPTDVENFRKSGGQEEAFSPPAIGLFSPGSHLIADGSALSPAHHPAINKAISIVQQACKECKVFGYIEGTGGLAVNHRYAGLLKYVLFNVDKTTEQVQLSIVWNTSAVAPVHGSKSKNSKIRKKETELVGITKRYSDIQLEDFKNALIRLSQDEMAGGPDSTADSSSNFFSSIWANYNPASSTTNAITGRDEWKILHGSEYIVDRVDTDMVEKSGFGTQLYILPYVFRQANADQFSYIVRGVRTWLSKFANHELHEHADQDEATMSKALLEARAQKQKLYCMELYGGVGTIGLNCIDLLQVLRCSDENPHNKECFEKSLSDMPKEYANRASYVSADATLAVSELFTKGPQHGFNACIVDPPRKGLSHEVLTALLRKPATKPNEIPKRHLKFLVYVSCGLKSFAHDADFLMGNTDVADNSFHNHSGAQKNRNHFPWRLVHAEGHILFPGSDHLETFAVFTRD
jgi:hypothetical protein